MRDLVIAAIVFGSMPFILARPHVGVLVWAWLAYMNPHRMTWSWAHDMPFAQMVAVVLLLSVVVTSEPRRIPWSPLFFIWLTWTGWIGLSTYFNHDFTNHPRVMYDFTLVLKIQLITLIIMVVMRSRRRVDALVWVIVVSLGFFGVKGGIFTILTGGSDRVWGPPGGFIEGNNEIGLALVMILPLMRYLQGVATRASVKNGLTVCMTLTAIAVVGTYSRGALLAGTAMGLLLAWNSKNKWRNLLVLLLVVPLALTLMPAQWFDRMNTIEEYQEDNSAMGRINAWNFAINVANDRPMFGGGFRVFSPEMFQRYAPDPEDYHDAHSIYFEVLAEQGYGGLFLFLLLGIGTWRAANWVKRESQGDQSVAWTGDLCRMIQVSLVGYAVGGAFLGLAYFDLYYNLIAFVILARAIILDRREEMSRAEADSIGSGPTMQFAG